MKGSGQPAAALSWGCLPSGAAGGPGPGQSPHGRSRAVPVLHTSQGRGQSLLLTDAWNRAWSQKVGDQAGLWCPNSGTAAGVKGLEVVSGVANVSPIQSRPSVALPWGGKKAGGSSRLTIHERSSPRGGSSPGLRIPAQVPKVHFVGPARLSVHPWTGHSAPGDVPSDWPACSQAGEAGPPRAPWTESEEVAFSKEGDWPPGRGRSK